MAVDNNKMNEFLGRFVTDLGAAVHAGMVVIGEKLGLYKALAEGPLNSAELAAKTKADERYVREWLGSQAAGGYVTYDEKTRKFSLSEEQASMLANEDSPAYIRGLSNWLSALLPLFPGLPSPSAPVQAWAGMNTTTLCFMAVRNSSVRAMQPTSIARGFPLFRACRPSSKPAPKSPMWAAARAHLPC